MNFYLDEKKRVGNLRIALDIVGWFLYFMQVQNAISYYRAPFLNQDGGVQTLPPTTFSFLNTTLTMWLVILVLYLNGKLFMITEQGKKVLLIPKYITVPISHKDLYVSKIRIMAQTTGIYYLGTIVVYYLCLYISADIVVVDISKNIVEMLQGVLLLIVFQVVLIITNVVHEQWDTKK